MEHKSETSHVWPRAFALKAKAFFLSLPLSLAFSLSEACFICPKGGLAAIWWVSALAAVFL